MVLEYRDSEESRIDGKETQHVEKRGFVFDVLYACSSIQCSVSHDTQTKFEKRRERGEMKVLMGLKGDTRAVEERSERGATLKVMANSLQSSFGGHVVQHDIDR